MLTVISPAKTLDYVTPLATQCHSQPALLAQAQQLAEIVQQLTPAEIASLMRISDKLAGLNAVRFNEWHLPFTMDNARQAILAFKGDVYTGLQADNFSEQDFAFAQQHLRILSGLYGMLRPLDLMQPYRLEMGTKLGNPAGRDLYHFWGDTLTQLLNDALHTQSDDVLINLASDEYFKAIKTQHFHGRIIKPVFLDRNNGKFRVISFHTKKARGLMCRFIIKNRLTQPEQLKDFDLAGYYYDEKSSHGSEYIFKRHEFI